MGQINRAAAGKGRSAVENLGGGAAGAMLAVSFIPESWGLNAYQLALAGVVATSAAAWVASAMRDKGVPGFGAVTKIGLVLGVLSALGCTSVMGSVTPREFTSVAGETVIACELEGWSFSVGDGGLCRVDDGGHVSTQEGGRVSETFRDLTVGTVETAGRITAGLFGGIGAAFSGIGSAAAPDE